MRRQGIRAALIAVALLTITATAGAEPATADEVVVVGLLPFKKAGGTPDLVGLREAQTLRTVAEQAIAALTQHPVLGHEGLSKLLGADYLPKWFGCRGSIPCVGKILDPVRAAGYRKAIGGDYVVVGGNYHVHLIAFSVVDGAVVGEATFDLSAAAVTDVQHWRTELAQLLAGHIRIGTNVVGPGCTLDGEPCAFEQDGKTITATPGPHTVELAKGGYLPEKATVTVVTGAIVEAAITLKPQDEERKVPTVVGPRHAPTLGAVRIDKHVEIDGKLDESVWQRAFVDTNFTQNFPDEAKPPTERTELRILYDDDAIYIGIRCYDSRPNEIVARLTRRDRDIESDKVTVDVSSKNDHATAFHFQVNAAGVQVDGTRFNDTDSSTDWDGVWFSGTSIDDKGWTAEIELPLNALRYSDDTTAFGFQVRRYLQRRGEIDEWSYVPRNVQGEVSYYGTLDGLKGLNARRLIRITPYDSRRVTFRTQQDYDQTRYGGNIGVDLKLGLTPALTLDATINPDFGTVEVDQVVLNLSTVETYFPEKRPFFIEGADLFTTPIPLFYSRRVGRDPPNNHVGGPREPPPDGQILAATKVTGTIANRLSIGVLDAVSAREDVTVDRMLGAGPEKILVDPLTNFSVLRLRQEFGQNSSVGVLATGVTRLEPAGSEAPMDGDLCPRPHGGVDEVGTRLDALSTIAPVGGRCTNDAYTGGGDAVLRTDDGKWGASAQVVGSVLEHGPPRIIPDGTVIRSGDAGLGVSGDVGKYGGPHWLFHVAYTYMSPKLEINDAGFNPTANTELLRPFLTLRSTDKFLAFLDTSLTLQANLAYTVDATAPQGRGLFLTWKATLPNFWTINTRFGTFLPHYDNRETRDGALLEGPRNHNFLGLLFIKTDPREPVIAELDAYASNNSRGLFMTMTATLNLRPLSFLELDVISDATWSYGDPRWIATEANAGASRTYYFQDLDSRSWDVLLRGTLTFSPTLSLQTYVQLYLDSGHYGRTTSINGSGAHPRLDLASVMTAMPPAGIDNDFRDSALNVNAFLRWEFRPGSTLWLVYTRNQLNLPYNLSEGRGRLHLDQLDGPSTDVVLVKLSYLWEPLQRR